jgi:mono/diheme cytochrome c family protein
MKTTTALACVMLAMGLASACGNETDAILGLTGDATNGQKVFEANCQSCHGADGKSGTVGRNITSASDTELVHIVLNGEDEMPSFADTLSDQEIADVLGYVSTL